MLKFNAYVSYLSKRMLNLTITIQIMSKALLLGASGLTGSFLMNKILNDDYYSHLTIVVRRKLEINHPKLTQIISDYSNIDELKNNFEVDFVFCCLGTTIKKAGSQEAFKQIDLEIPVKCAELAKQNGCKGFYMQSSLGADSNSKNFYLQVKGQCEDKIKSLNFDSFATFRPSMLLGPRKEFRLGELFGKIVMQGLFFLFIGKLKRYKAIKAERVAEFMLQFPKPNPKGYRIIESEQML